MLWGKWGYNDHFFDHNYLPILMKYKVDIYHCGHEHLSAYANYDLSKPVPTSPYSIDQIQEEIGKELKGEIKNDDNMTCYYAEIYEFFYDHPGNRS